MKIYRIVIHCAATAVDSDYTEKDLERDHLVRGIASPGGYHYYIRKDGRKVKMRPFDRQGAHALPFNRDSLGFCYEGGLKAGGRSWRGAEDTRTDAQKAGLLDCIYEGMNYFVELAKKRNEVDFKIEIIGHGQLQGVAKECPSFDAKSEYAWITA